jgi:hypothetical protein
LWVVEVEVAVGLAVLVKMVAQEVVLVASEQEQALPLPQELLTQSQ